MGRILDLVLALEEDLPQYPLHLREFTQQGGVMGLKVSSPPSRQTGPAVFIWNGKMTVMRLIMPEVFRCSLFIIFKQSTVHFDLNEQMISPRDMVGHNDKFIQGDGIVLLG